MADKIFDSTIGALNTSMNARMLNQGVINSNIANADTPNYKAKKVEFETALREALNVGEGIRPEITHVGHQVPQDLDPINPEIVEDTNGVESLDGNTVDRSAEMAKSSENQIMYNASVELLKKKLGMLKYGISEGGGNN